eukprot:CAMPEP_0173257970 /NCGR_PEP_ID=MMETSP1142-20121109/24094_1 /TAXON_ID=483371 /ORGANISM="non described non described, Strain CCMP2298" /LENGTH=450 /DNA_ID=CAMNT_0014192215 /DNA_START=100 /DNA_END=1449 /DNA_ORIENTATION=-
MHGLHGMHGLLGILALMVCAQVQGFQFHSGSSASSAGAVQNRFAENRQRKMSQGQTLGRGQSSLRMSAALPTLISAVSVAGVIAFHEAGHFLAAKAQGMKVQSYNIGYGPKLLSFNDSSDTEFAIRAVPLGGYVAFPANLELDEETGEVLSELSDPDLLQNRPPLQRALVISAGVIANIILTFAVCTGVAVSTGLNRPVYGAGIRVTQLQAVTTQLDVTTPAYRAGLRVDDVITKVNGQPVVGSESTVEGFIAKIRSSENTPLLFEIRRPIRSELPTPTYPTSSTSSTSSTSILPSGAASAPPTQTLTLSVTPAVNSGGKVSIGVGVGAVISELISSKAGNPLEAVTMGAQETGRLFIFTCSSLYRAAASGFVGNELGGPIAVVSAGAAMAEYSPTALLGFIANLSINLAVLNSLPFPALDGGQLVFVILEVLGGRPVPRKIQETVTAAA